MNRREGKNRTLKMMVKGDRFDCRLDPHPPTVEEYQALTGCSDMDAFKFGEELLFLAYRQRIGEPLLELDWSE